MRYSNIQILRVFAAVGVVLHHLGYYAPRYAEVGREWLLFPVFVSFPVPLFFAVSGFVLAHAVRSASPGRFLLARFLRLYPGFWLAVVGTLLLMRFRVFTEIHRWLVKMTSVGSFTLWPGGEGATAYTLGVEWSLIYEVFLSAALAAFALFGSKRAVPVLAGVWLAVIAGKVVGWPNLYTDVIPHWSTIALSAFNVPFLFGVLAYQVKDAGRPLRWAVLPAIPAIMYFAATVPTTLELAWVCWGVAGVASVWVAVQLPQLSDRNPLVRLGDCTYGLFLVHVPLMWAVLYPASRLGWNGRVEVLWLAGAVAIVGGLAFGRLESAIHTRLRPIAKWNAAEFGGVLVRLNHVLRRAVGGLHPHRVHR
mgnify:FL=1